MVEHKPINPETHEIIVWPNPAILWSSIKKIYFCFVILIITIHSKLYQSLPSNTLLWNQNYFF